MAACKITRWKVVSILVLGGVIALLVALAACGAEATPTPTPRPPTPTAIPATATPTPRPATPTPPIPSGPTATPTAALPTATPRPGETPRPATATPVPPTATPTPVAPTPTPRPKALLGGLPPSTIIPDAEWAKIVAAAKKEGKLMVYSWELTSWRDAWAKETFKAATGIEMDILSISSSWTVERIASEDRAGIYSADVVNIVGTYFPGMEKKGWLARTDNLPALKDATDPDLWYASPLQSPFYFRTPSIRTGVFDFTYNTKVIPPERVPKTHRDLLDPYFKNMICLTDPAQTNATSLVMWRNWRGLDYADWYAEIFYDITNKAAGRVYFSAAGAPSPLNRGECGMGLPFYGVAAGDLKNTHVAENAPWIAGANWEYQVAVLGLHQSFNAMLAKAPHPNAALVFLNWRLSKEGQAGYAGARGTYPPLRKDIPDPVEKKYWPQEGKGVKNFWIEDEAWSGYEEYMANNRIVMRMMKEGMSKEAWLKEAKSLTQAYWGQYPPPKYPFFPY